MLAGAGLAFARAVGEFGSIVLISGDLPYKTQVASAWIYSLSQSNELGGAAAVSTVLVAISLAVLLAIGWLRRRFDVGMSAADAARDIDLGPYSGWSEGERIVVNVGCLYREFGAEMPGDSGNLMAEMAAWEAAR